MFFKDPGFNFQAIRTLSETYGQAADIGEVISTIKKIEESNIESWKNEWLKTADRLYADAQKVQEENSIRASQNEYLRASNYYRTGSFYMTSRYERKESIALRKKAIKCFLKYISGKDFIRPVQIPYENNYLPGYFIKSSYLKDGKAPLIIINTGFDGTKEETCYQTGFEAAEFGYNVLVLDGPGQGETIYNQKLFFRYDWEKVITPAIDFGLTLEGVDKDKIAVYGISMGGYLIPRAAAFDNRIKACIANGGVSNFYEPFVRNFPKDFMLLKDSDPEKFNQEIMEIGKKMVEVKWFIENGMWTFNVETPIEFLNKMKKYDLTGVAEKIKCKTLIIDGSEDTFMRGQPELLYSELKCEKTFMLFDEESTGQLHCQLGALGISNERIYTWLNNALDYHPYKK
ncbi:MAG: hypothetical protein A2X47_07115 [Lentisphaerae bacterium GWF2_38_69]|nr:MAG: hypothetical protein A2X47_07115 [Lentisphaerae bacterium GWF2_38_69]